MKLFNKNKKQKDDFLFVLDSKEYLIDDMFIVKLPINWLPYASDKFRAKTKDNKTQISIVNYAKEGTECIDSQFFKNLKLELYDRYVSEGKYEPYDDLIVNNDFISKSFKVDKETHYYLTKAYNVDDNTIITEFIMRDIGNYNVQMRTILQTIAYIYKIRNI
jgi:hypothetical protein